LQIDIVADVICPWCFIGKRRLERALACRPDIPVSITWRAFLLNPEMPKGGTDRAEYISAKFGGETQAKRLQAAIAEAGARENIRFDLARIRRTPNSMDAHRLIRYAGRSGLAETVVETLFSAYFLAGADIGDTATLIRIAAECGLPDQRLASWIESDAESREVRAEDRRARRLGITGVPSFIIDRSYVLAGAQEPEFFLPLFDLATNARHPFESV
jgi:predicted DsbA family dithiol-disulfide isomerase